MVSREDFQERLRRSLEANEHILGCVPGSGIVAQAALKGGASFLAVLNSGVFRRRGRASISAMLPYGDANFETQMLWSREVMPIIPEDYPVVCGYCAADGMRGIEEDIARIKSLGFSGIINYPSLCVYDETTQYQLEENGFSFSTEVQAIAMAREQGLYTIGLVVTPEQARRMARRGADMICVHLGLTGGGFVGAHDALSLLEAAKLVNDIHRAVEAYGVVVTFIGGPAKSPEDVRFLYDNTAAVGFIGGSAIDRLPVESAVAYATRQYRNASLNYDNARLMEMLEDVGKNHNYVDFAIKLVHMNYMQELSMEEIAKVIHISSRHLSRQFQREMGMSFSTYLRKVRIQEAMEIVKKTSLAMEDVALAVGYREYNSFYKSFIAVTGVSPTKYRGEHSGEGREKP